MTESTRLIPDTAPLAIDLCCGLGGWAEAFLAEGYRVIGFDIKHFRYPAQLVIQDIRTVCGRGMFRAAVIVASPPCEEFTRHQMPWTLKRNPPEPDLSVVNACFRIAEEAGVPIVLENVRKAQSWLGTAKAHYGSQYLWGDVPAILPLARMGGDRVSKTPDGFERQKQTWASSARAERAKIPFALARHIAQCFKPRSVTTADPKP